MRGNAHGIGLMAPHGSDHDAVGVEEAVAHESKKYPFILRDYSHECRKSGQKVSLPILDLDAAMRRTMMLSAQKCVC